MSNPYTGGERQARVMRRFDIAAAFCPSISTHPSIDYSRVVPQALHSYPASGGDPVTALTFYAKHSDMRIKNAQKYITKYLNDVADDIAAQEYRNSWVSRYTDYLERKDD